MIQTIRVYITKGPDLPGEGLLHEIKHNLGITTIEHIRSAKVYLLEGMTEKQAKKLAETAFCEKINQDYTINAPIYTSTKVALGDRVEKFSTSSNNNSLHAIEIAYRPGVMNPEVGSILKSAEDLGIKLIAADSSREFSFHGNISKDELYTIITKLNLYNPLIEHIVTEEPKTLQISGKVGKTTTIPIRSLSDTELMELSKDTLFLNLVEMKVIQQYFGKIKRDPTDCEIEILAQTWSEHCVHKTFKADLTIDGKKKKPLFERIKSTARGHDAFIVSAFADNSGVIDFYDGYYICGKVETHNSPSAIEPYGGAMTGSGGVFRDILGTGQGAKPLISTDIFCFAPPHLPAKDLPPGCLPPSYLLKRVVQGVRDYGNRVGIPTNNGSIHFHEDFRAKPTVAVGAYGIIKKSKAKKGTPKPKDLIVIIGGRTGRDGIHGATFSSGEMTDRTMTVSGTAVQIGNAIEEKRVIDAVQILQEKGYIRAITDCGAGGYSSAIGEMASKTGAKVFLEKVPLKYPGLSPWEIFLSESQERMVIAIDSKNKKKVFDVLKLFNVEGSIIAEFDGSKRLQVFYNKEKVADLTMDFLHDGLPKRHMVGKTRKSLFDRHSGNPPAGGASRISSVSSPKRSWTSPSTGSGRSQDDGKTLVRSWEKIMSHGNVNSKEPILRLYDHTVQGRAALQPLGGINFDAPNDGSIVKPFHDKPYGLVVTHGLNPILNQIDPYWGSIWAITEAVSNYVAIGGDLKYAALIDNFIWPFPDEESLADLDKAVDACVTMSKLLSMPFVSGKDSLSSTYRFKDGKVLKIPPVLLISVFGKILDVRKTASSDFKRTDSVIVFVGKQDTSHLGGSVYLNDLNHLSDNVPRVDIKTLPKTLAAITKGIQNNDILSCHDISEGGLAAAIVEMAFGAGFGANIDLSKISKTRPDFVLFNETAGTFLVEVENESVAKKLFKNTPYAIVGKTVNKPTISVSYGKKELVNVSIERLKNAWQKPMREIFS